MLLPGRRGHARHINQASVQLISRTDFLVMPSLIPNGNIAEEDISLKYNSGTVKNKRWGLVATGIMGEVQMENILKMLKFRSGTFVDIGSGDGRIVIAAAKKGFQAVGYELNPWLVWYSRYKAWREGVHQNTKFNISDLWKVSFSQYTNVVIFGVPHMMPLLERKLQNELSPTSRVIACRFPFPNWIPDHISGHGIDTVWVYDKKISKDSSIKASMLKLKTMEELNI
ncbi:ATP synthase subunit C lysine N-methyltransferase-like isoform 3-T3 [Anomaloglossus baeobatrachus]|uniref:ATP synthase subunit C lysine N-methyltransferase-like isoform X3 n=1 Tax=Anomaloglossus baeobatrachus TaxID=238106 RepID=UPI003F500F52